MPLSPGTRLGGYDIVAKLGEGGMGEVYRARDTRLGRDVALKILPEAFASDPDRLMRFEREARTLAALNHPNIAQVHGLEESPSAGSGQAGTRALVMELVAGEDLSTRIARGPIPLDEALPIARQIAEALEAAHEAGIIHRDLKPANIKVRDDGTVKVLDFGLAKALDGAPDALNDGATITSPAMTMRGVILGTAAYMAPEQAKGKPVDRRADIWAFGCVLYEMLTGRRAFKGDDISDTITAVLRDEPDWTALPAVIPAHVRTLLRRCLQKDARQRLPHIGLARLELTEGASTPLTAAADPVNATHTLSATSHRTPGGVLVGVAVLAAAFGFGVLAARPSAPVSAPAPPALRAGLALPWDARVTQLAMTPDGTRLIYVGGDGTRLMVRRLDSMEPEEIASGALLSQPFVSPDGRWVGFVDEASHLLKVPLGGGPTTDLGVLDGRIEGAAWLDTDTIVVGTEAASGLLRLAAAGGQPPKVLTSPAADADHVWPQRLPDGTGLLFTVVTKGNSQGPRQLAVADAATGAVTVIAQGGGRARIVPGGHLAYVSTGTLFVLPFDASARTVPPGATPRDTGVRTSAFDVAPDGTLVYAGSDTSSSDVRRTPVWVDRSGRETAIPAEPRRYQYPAISPDGAHVVIAALGDGDDLWMLDVATSRLSRLTFDPATDTTPVWTPDGRSIIFASNRGNGVYNLWRQAADGTGEPERLTTSRLPQFSTAVTPDGRHALFWQATPNGSRDVFMVALDGSHTVTPVVQTPAGDMFAAVSPDGRWLAYESNASGRRNIVVRPFPNIGGGQWQITTDQGRQPWWSKNGKELFFFDADGSLSRIEVIEASGAFRAGAIETLLPPRYYGSQSGALVSRTYDVSANGQRFLVFTSADDREDPRLHDVFLIQHWAATLTLAETSVP